LPLTIDRLLREPELDWNDIWDGETRLWTAPPEERHELLDPAVVMVLPHLPQVLQHRTGARALGRQPSWDRADFDDQYMLQLTDDLRVVGYQVRVERGEQVSEMVCTSVWRMSDKGWRLVQHQRCGHEV
jgi:hypothetical protein